MTDRDRPQTPEELLATLREVRARLDNLEQIVLKMQAAQREEPAPAAPPPPFAPIEAAPPVVTEPPAAAAPPPPPTEPVAVPPPPPPPPEPSPAEAAAMPKGPSLEQRIGTRWMLFAGVIVLLIGAVLFFMYAVERGWIDEPVRCIIGAAAGLAMIIVGEWMLRQKMRLLAAGLFGVGIVCLYFTTYVASPRGLYGLIGTNLAFGLMCGVTVIGAALSLRSRMLACAVISLVGAIATPILLSTGKDEQVILMSYLLVVNAGFLTLAVVKRWQALAPIALAGTILLATGWALKFYEPEKLALTIGFAWGLLGLFWAYAAAGVLTRRAHEAIGGIVLIAGSVAVAVQAVLICDSAADTHALSVQMLVILGAMLTYALWRRWSELMVCAAVLIGVVGWLWFAWRYDAGAVPAMCAYAWVYLAMLLAAIVFTVTYRWRAQSISILSTGAVLVTAGWVAMRGDLPPNAFALQLLALNTVVLAMARRRHWPGLGIGVVAWTAVALTVAYCTWEHTGVNAADFMTLRIWPLFALIVLDVAAYNRPRWRQTKSVQLALAAPVVVAAWLAMNAALTWDSPELVLAVQLLVLNVIVLGMCMWRRWHWLRAGVVAWTAGALAILHADWSGARDMSVFTSQWAWVMFGLLSVDVLVRAWWEKLRTIEWLDAVLATVSMGLMFAASYLLLRDQYQRWMGTYTAGLAVGAIAIAILVRRLADRRGLAYAYLGQGLVLAALAVPIQYDKCTVALAWAVQGVVAVFLAKRLKNKMLLAMCVIVLTLAVVHFLAMDMPGDPRMKLTFLRAGTIDISYAVLLAIGLSAALLASAAIVRWGGAMFDEEAERALGYVMIVAGMALYYGITAAELPVVASTWWWLVAAGGLAAVGVWRGSEGLSGVALGALAAVVAKWAGCDTLFRRLTVGADLSGLVLLNWQLWAGIAVAAALMIYFWQMRYWDISIGAALTPVGNIVAGMLILWAGSFEVDRYFNTEAGAVMANREQMMQMAYSLWWAIWALLLVAVGFIFSRREVRYLALCILAVTLGKVLLVDLRETAAVYRVLSFIGLGLLLLGGVYIYTRAFRPKGD